MELHKIQDIDGILNPEAGVSGGKKRAWGLGTGDGKTHFILEVQLVEGTFTEFGIGVSPAATTLSKLSTADSGVPLFRARIGDGKLTVGDSSSPLPSELLIDNLRQLRLQCLVGENPGVFLCVNSERFIDVTKRFPKPLIPGSYKPCISIAEEGIKFRYRVMYKPCVEPTHTYAARTGRGIWEQRQYTDMVVVCTTDQQRIPCHRAHLASGSPIFSANLARWSKEAMPEVEVVGKETEIAAMLEFFYTGELRAGADASALLPVAHYYQNNDFLVLVIERLFVDLSLQTALAAVKALAPLRDQDEQLQLAWRELCSRAACQTEMIEVLMLGLSEASQS